MCVKSESWQSRQMKVSQGDGSRHIQSCQTFVFMSDPQQGTFTSMVIRPVSVSASLSIRAIRKERGSSRVSGCWS